MAQQVEAPLKPEHPAEVRGAEPHKLRLSTPYYLSKQEIDRFLGAFDEYKKKNTS